MSNVEKIVIDYEDSDDSESEKEYDEEDISEREDVKNYIKELKDRILKEHGLTEEDVEKQTKKKKEKLIAPAAVPRTLEEGAIRKNNISDMKLRSAQRTWISKFFQLQLLNDKDAYFKDIDPIFLEMYDQYKEWEDLDTYKMRSKDIIGWFITVAPICEDVKKFDYVQFVKKCLKYLGRSTFSEIHACFEQTGDTEELRGRHPHFHALVVIKTDSQMKEPTRFKKSVSNAFKQYSGSKETAYCLNTKAISKETFQPRLNYVKGQKKDKEKESPAVMEQTLAWRASLSLPNYITNQ